MDNQNTALVTGKVRLSYVNLFTPKAPLNGGDPKYSCTILLPKSDTATKMAIDKAIENAKQKGIQKLGGVIPPILPIPIYDGDGVRPSDGLPFGDECKGHLVFTASCKRAPEVVDVNVNFILDQKEIYSGIYGRVSINFYAYNHNGKKGIGCGLKNVQKLEDGEPLGGVTTAVSDFGQPVNNTQPQYAPQAQQSVPYTDPLF